MHRDRAAFWSLAPLLLGLSLPAPPRAEDWPEFRGPTGQGTTQFTGLPTEWAEGRNLAWKQKVPGTGWSSPVVVGGKVFLTSAVANKENLSLQLHCLDAGTGKTLWTREAFTQKAGTRIHSKNSHASPTALVADGLVYVHFGPHGTACFDVAGKEVWKVTVPYSPVHGNGGSPALVDGLLVFSCDGSDQRFVVALDAKTGKERRRTARSVKAPKGFSFGTPLVITVAGKKQVISPGSNMVGAYDPATGKELWRVRYEGYSVIPRPVFAHGLLYLSTSYDRAKLLAIAPDGSGDVTDTHLKWTLAKNAPHTPSPLVVGDEVFVVADNGFVSCLDAKSGDVHWQKRVASTYSASPILAGGHIYLVDERGACTVLKAGKQFEVVGKSELGEKSLASPAVADGALFLRTEGHLLRVQGK